MILTERPLSPAMKNGGNTVTGSKNVHSKKVKFASKESTVVGYVPLRSEIDNQDDIWISGEDRVEERKNSLNYSKELQEKYPALVKGMECIYQWADLTAQEEKENATQSKPRKHDFLEKWASLSSDRRGLEKKIISKSYQKKRMQSVEGSRRCVLALQELYNKTAKGDATNNNNNDNSRSQQEEVMRKQYEDLSRPFKIFAMTLALTDEAVAKSYQSKKSSSSSSSSSSVKKVSSTGSLRSLSSSKVDSEVSLNSLGKSSRSKKRSSASPKKNRRSLSPKKTPKTDPIDLGIVVPPAC